MKRFKEKWEEYTRWKYPSLPDYAICFPTRKYPTKTTNGITKIISTYMYYKGWHCERFNNMGVMIDNTTTVIDVLGFKQTIGIVKWRKGTGKNGTADLSANIDGKTVKIEIKNEATRDRMSPDQFRYKNIIETTGGIYKVITTTVEGLDFCDEFPDNPNKEVFWLLNVKKC